MYFDMACCYISFFQLVGHPEMTHGTMFGAIGGFEALEQGVWPEHVDRMAWPNGGTLYFIDTMQAIFLAVAKAIGSGFCL